ncbi:hypothetical protein NMF83_14860 [Clostridioides difficile]|uniref:ABC-three component system middle component 6 n=1 Tax=Clostridioides difficile TaxID=1496 RepID=UPI000D1EC83B|nr:ABC-three component system middle component 6 [Clostridioides difficile]EGT4907920.1 hypothetical protein [Clostridioides difficile]EGT5013921.1 hypothetical protein [Clostridioides difficile]MBF9986778.1 hypothetical protein [Clostridioides difficile]MBH7479683.1 hypothetical protein [Clostridioides difficile]MCI2276339.1 hypothetical protein [Clostridioides difficile]
MIVDFDKSPSNSIIYTSSIILDYLKDEKKSRDLEALFRYCLERKMEYSMFFLSIDWLYLIGVVETINERSELVLCT